MQQPSPHIYTVSDLNSEIKSLLENKFTFLWITGEISNFRMPASGHFYFTLKDHQSQISSVMFSGQNRKLKFDLEDGLKITGMGRISLFEPRGTYQIIFEYIEPEGIGALQIAFEQLKEKLHLEGLFDEAHKKPLPFLPQKITLITSPTGAVVHDMVEIANRRHPGIRLEIIPVKVQGENAEKEIINGIDLLNRHSHADLAILARGGGSLEDLQAFNSEKVARAVFASNIPIISAVGHETDFTIVDFVSDLRAPTPSAAAELAVPNKHDLIQFINEKKNSLENHIKRMIRHLSVKLNEIQQRLIDPKRKIIDLRLRADDYTTRLSNSIHHYVSYEKEKLSWRKDKLYSYNPSVYVNKLNNKHDILRTNLFNNITKCIDNYKSMLREKSIKLDTLNPTAILSRGYSITRTLPEHSVVRHTTEVNIQQDVEVLLSKGKLKCRITEVNKKCPK
ncbi:MAG: exodeoxyribonuclease VII large subunit [Thermodesulfobacteriota bacterium]|nr:exodeoxyribonuclease VII large subunit [Thermodesulfobacteriota bacterium]